MKRQGLKKIITGIAAVAVMGTIIACGVKHGALTDTAAVRGVGEGEGEYYLDDEAIALASRAATTQTMDEAVQVAFNLTNEQRSAKGLGGFVSNGALADAAKVRAQEIVSTFSHTRPDGSQFWTVNSDVQWGENLAKLYNSGDTVVSAWMASPTHAANILAADYASMGIGIYQNGSDWYWAQEFGR